VQMCGVAGFVNKDKSPAQIGKLKIMTDAIAHRGPDDEGQLIWGNAALGHRRLSIIDLSSAGRQPMESRDGRFVITFNGEIYNYVELKQELTGLGAKFRNDTDTEVIMEAYRFWGTDCFNKFNGMWAFAIFDKKVNRLIISRDRFAVKPLYVLNNERLFMFASEVKAIIKAEPAENIPDSVSIYRYLLSTASENIDDHSWYRNVKIFPPASYAVYDILANTYETYRYWTLDIDGFNRKWIDRKEPASTLKELFDDAVKIRLRADVEVGTCLSGGLDSSSIVGCCAKKHGVKMQTFSSRFTDKTCDEREYIDAANRFSNANAHPIHPDDSSKGFISAFREIINNHDGPPAGASLYAQYSVFKEVGKHLKVVLDGQGADELFGGYAGFWNPYIRKVVGEKSKLKAMKCVCDIMAEYDLFDMSSLSTDTAVALFGVDYSVELSKQNLRDIGKTSEIMMSYPRLTDAFRSLIADVPINSIPSESCDEINQICVNQTLLTSIPALCHNEDSNSMQFSVEVRMPFLDYRIVEFALALDSEYKMRGKWQKWIMRKAFKEYLPMSIRRRRNKMGYPAPFFRWLREADEKEEFKEIIYSFADRGITPLKTIDAYYKAHMSGEYNLESILFKFLVLELWLRTCNSEVNNFG
jgi:asparagine synthase (glutamine-hydrolysing)